MDSQEIYNRVDNLRKIKGWTINHLSEMANIAHSTINTWRVRGTLPTLTVLEAICDALGVSVTQLLTDEEHSDLASDEIRLLNVWAMLDKSQKEAVFSMICVLAK